MQNKIKVYYSTGSFSVTFTDQTESDNKDADLLEFVEKVKKESNELSALSIEERSPVLDITSLLEDQYLYSMS